MGHDLPRKHHHLPNLETMPISFLPSQLATESQTPLSYTDDPKKLLKADILLCISKFPYLWGIISPLRFGKDASPFDELYLSWVNIKSIVIHGILIVAQLAFLASVPFFIIAPTFWLVAYIAAFWLFNRTLCGILNGDSILLEPSEDVVQKVAARGPMHEKEYWIYLNGVSVGKDWLRSNLDRLTLTFGRKVCGVHNPTDGIVFDLFQCLIQRNLYYATNDIREAYVKIKDRLYDDKIDKVVFILHSQGGIEGGLIVDWLLAEVPQDKLSRLEVYTFGNAANHFNNPQRQGISRRTSTHQKIHSIMPLTQHHTPKVIGHIEHYANMGDYVSQFGVLHYAAVGSEAARNRFMGRVFVSPQSGHLLNQHYLHQMFSLTEDLRCAEHNAFIDMDVEIYKPAEGSDTRESAVESVESPAVLSKEAMFIADTNSPISPLMFASPSTSLASSLVGSLAGSTMAEKTERRMVKVRNLSRLWLYRNGGCPPEDGHRHPRME